MADRPPTTSGPSAGSGSSLLESAGAAAKRLSTASAARPRRRPSSKRSRMRSTSRRRRSEVSRRKASSSALSFLPTRPALLLQGVALGFQAAAELLGVGGLDLQPLAGLGQLRRTRSTSAISRRRSRCSEPRRASARSSHSAGRPEPAGQGERLAAAGRAGHQAERRPAGLRIELHGGAGGAAASPGRRRRAASGGW